MDILVVTLMKEECDVEVEEKQNAFCHNRNDYDSRISGWQS